MRYLKNLLLLVACCMISSIAMADDWYIITADVANVYSEPNRDSEILGQYEKDETLVTVDTIRNGWLEIAHDGNKGYISDKDIAYDRPYVSTHRTVWVVNTWLEKYNIVTPLVDDVIFTSILAGLALALYIVSKLSKRSEKDRPVTLIIGHLLSIILAVAMLWQLLMPHEGGSFSNHIVWYFADHSWLRKGIYFIILVTAIIFVFNSVTRLFSKEKTPRKAKMWWYIGLASWPLFTCAIIITSMFSDNLDTVTWVFIGLQAIFIVGMLIYYFVNKQFFWPLLLMLSYLIMGISFASFIGIAIALVIVIIMALVIGYLCISFSSGLGLGASWIRLTKRYDGDYDGDDGNVYERDSWTGDLKQK